ncbi:MAG: carboxypeptidase-like regulatory domain-containing protein [Prolixibacteraceae bacterium]|jgi:hypothetical protein|nr:carboxypeptidase-like regulatory domain-containing protein [Prolixibacteraceae bacterium]
MRHIIYIITILILIPFGVSAQNLVMLSGVVKDSISNEPVKGVNIVVESNNTGTISDNHGEYILYLTEGEYKITFSVKGYEEHILTAELKSNAEYFVEMQPKIKSLSDDTDGSRGFFSFLNRKPERNQMIAEKAK